MAVKAVFHNKPSHHHHASLQCRHSERRLTGGGWPGTPGSTGSLAGPRARLQVVCVGLVWTSSILHPVSMTG
eukprot:2398261-Rhodomonas_salina.1